MGRPSHYSTDIPARGKELIELLVRYVEENSDPTGKWGGPLKTTFLLSMATPMLVLPIERIFRSVVEGRPGVADDAGLDPRIDARVAEVLGPGRSFEKAPFFEAGVWHFVSHSDVFNVGGHWPVETLRMLASAEAETCARNADAAEILMVLRNALAHGGVTYLDREGGQTEAATNMLGFASTTRGANPRGLRLLRVPVDAFQTFVAGWADWLTSSGVADHLNNRGPGYFEQVAA